MKISVRVAGIAATLLVSGAAVAQTSDKVSKPDVLEVEKEKVGDVAPFGPALENESFPYDTRLQTPTREYNDAQLEDLVTGYAALRDSSDIAARVAPAETLERFRNDSEYQYDRVQAGGPSLLELFVEWINRTFFRPIAENTSDSFWFWFWIFAAVAAIGWVISRILSSESGGFFRRSDAAALPEGPTLLDVENIEQIDLHALLDAAIIERRYRDSVRFMYLIALQRLSHREIITWDKHKTNREYLFEVRNYDRNLVPPFSQVTSLFEWVWYGETALDEATFPYVRTSFDSFDNVLSDSRKQR